MQTLDPVGKRTGGSGFPNSGPSSFTGVRPIVTWATTFNKFSGTSPGYPLTTIPNSSGVNKRYIVSEPNAFKGRPTVSSNKKSQSDYPAMAKDGVQPQLARNSVRATPYNINKKEKFFRGNYSDWFYWIIFFLGIGLITMFI